MKFNTHTALIAVAAALLLFPIISQSGTTPAERVVSYYQRSEENYAAYNFLQAMDSGNYVSLWKKNSPIAKNGLTESSWTTTLVNIRKIFGLYKDGIEERYDFSSQMSNGEKGTFYALIFKPQFSTLTAEEKIILSYENSEWKLAGYFIKTYSAK